MLTSFKTLGLTAPLFKQLQNSKTTYLHGIYFINGIALVIGILLLYTYPFDWKGVLFFVIMVIVINLFAWGIPFLFKVRQKKSLEQKMTEAIQESQDENLDFLSLFNLKFSRNQWLLVMILLILPGITYLLGGGVAAGQKSYQCFSPEKDLAVLKKYNDLLICRKFDSATKQFKDTLFIIKMTDNIIYKFTEQKERLKMP